MNMNMNIPHIIGLHIGGAKLILNSLIESHQGNPSYRYYVISSIIFGEVGEQSQEGGVEGRTYGINVLCAEVFFV
jgi:hypothetical protein